MHLRVNVFNFGQLSYSWAETVERIFEPLFLPTPADLSRKDIWFLQQLPVRNSVRSLLVWCEENQHDLEAFMLRPLVLTNEK